MISIEINVGNQRANKVKVIKTYISGSITSMQLIDLEIENLNRKTEEEVVLNIQICSFVPIGLSYECIQKKIYIYNF